MQWAHAWTLERISENIAKVSGALAKRTGAVDYTEERIL